MRNLPSRSVFHIAVPILGFFSAAVLIYLGWIIRGFGGILEPAGNSEIKAWVSIFVYVLGAAAFVATTAYIVRHNRKRDP